MYSPRSLEYKVARVSVNSFCLYLVQGRMKSSNTTAASEFRPEDTVLKQSNQE